MLFAGEAHIMHITSVCGVKESIFQFFAQLKLLLVACSCLFAPNTKHTMYVLLRHFGTNETWICSFITGDQNARFRKPVVHVKHHERACQFLELFFMRSSLFLMSNILSGSADIESVVSVDCETTEGCKEKGNRNIKLALTYNWPWLQKKNTDVYSQTNSSLREQNSLPARFDAKFRKNSILLMYCSSTEIRAVSLIGWYLRGKSQNRAITIQRRFTDVYIATSSVWNFKTPLLPCEEENVCLHTLAKKHWNRTDLLTMFV